ncbi:hypothetical protein Droror1_Dr00020378, partial [Drosera rotundifolia]
MIESPQSDIPLAPPPSSTYPRQPAILPFAGELDMPRTCTPGTRTPRSRAPGSRNLSLLGTSSRVFLCALYGQIALKEIATVCGDGEVEEPGVAETSMAAEIRALGGVVATLRTSSPPFVVKAPTSSLRKLDGGARQPLLRPEMGKSPELEEKEIVESDDAPLE